MHANILHRKHLVILHLIIYLERVYVDGRSHTSPIILSTMYIHLHYSVSTMLRSGQKSEAILISQCMQTYNPSCTRLRLLKLYHNINHAHTSTLQRLKDAAIRTAIEAKVISQSIFIQFAIHIYNVWDE